MGMDLEPINPSKFAPRSPADDKYSPNEVIWGRYNWSDWSEQIKYLQQWGIDTSEFSGTNDGFVISAETCEKVGYAILSHLDELPSDRRLWPARKALLWLTCGGYKQF